MTTQGRQGPPGTVTPGCDVRRFYVEVAGADATRNVSFYLYAISAQQVRDMVEGVIVSIDQTD